ncbi:MAG: DUF4251 domain-containing protein [Chlorobi bacterium]|nr:DUF4251 domain-containing protein [Chlorobiota bacterium]
MKRTILFMMLLTLVFSVQSFGQEQKLTRKERRALEKQRQAEMDSILAIQVKQAINEKKWVLEADRLSNKMGQTINVNSNLNFVAIEGDEAYVQLGRDSGLGPNGVGGVTVRANVTKYEVNPNEKKGTYYIHVFLTSALGSFDIRIDTNNTGQMASATVQGNSSRRVTYSGRLVPLSQSTVYKGTPLF